MNCDREKVEGKILVVDDSRTARFAMRSQLMTEGYSTIEASNGFEAVEILKENRVSLITLDVDMPRMNGFETCRMIAALYSVLSEVEQCEMPPIIFITGKDSIEERRKGYEAGACDFLSKSLIKDHAFIESVNKYLKPNLVLSDSNVLIVDDTKLVRFMLARCLHSLGANTEEVGSSQEAYDLLVDGGSIFDLIILDNHMPNMGGLELCQLIRRELAMRDVPVLFLGGTEDKEQQLNFFKVGGTDYLAKPFIREELEARVLIHIKNSKQNQELIRLRRLANER
jgi:two-component system cell cycle response regulator